ncbi:AAA family ATPase [Streptomyces racemochromogenes]|uniref:AAA family ATPase n=1 Tax=Streptomyces racemochromogenes TaxID=67353 RepID=A0ABW7PKB3_9ACTN
MVDRAPLVGRGAELDRLDAVIGAVVGAPQGDAPGVIDLTGPAGMGKSRLLTEVCRRARARGLTVLRGRATEYERHIPFSLFTDAFADLDPEAIGGRGADPAVAPVLYGAPGPTPGPDGRPTPDGGPAPETKPVPDGEPTPDGRPAPDGRPGPRGGPGQHAGPGQDAGTGAGAGADALGGTEVPVDRFAVHRAAARLLTALARGPGDGGRRGLLLALDDLHWADPASLELLDHLVRHPPRGPVLLVVARRDRQTSASLAAALTRGVDTGAVQRLDLGPLAEQTCVEQLAPGLPPARAGRLYAASGGNPLYFLTLLQGQAAGPAVPAGGLTALLLDELTPLTTAERRTAEAVAVLGDQATAPVLAQTAEVSGHGLLDAHLAALAGRDLLRPGPGGSWSLRHPVLRTVVYENTEPRRRTGLHRRAAAALAAAGAAAAVRAHHVERALTGWDPGAADALLEAAGQAETTAPASCAHWLGVVLGILPDTPEHLARRHALQLRRARALGACGELRASRDLLMSLIAQVDGTDPDDGLRAAAVTLCASMERHLGRYGEAVALLRRELARRPAPRPADALALGLELGSCAPHVLSYTAVREDVLRTYGLALRLRNEPAAAGALTTAALGETYAGLAPATARRLADRAAVRVDALADRELADLCEPLARLAWTEFYLDRFPEAERHADRGLALARRVGPPHLLPHLLVCKAVVHMNTCRLESAVELSEEAENIARGIGSDELLGLVLGNKAQVLIPSLPPGDPAPLALAEEAVALSGVRSSWWASLGWCVLSYAALYAGDHQRARSAMLRAGRGPELTGLQPSMRPLFLEALVNAAVAAGDLQEAESWAARAAEDAARLGLPAQRASALRSAAAVRAARDEPSEATDLYVRAAAEAARAGATLWESQALLMAAPLAARAGGSRRASTLWHRGRRLAEAGGARLLTGLADLFPPAPAHPPLPHLTPREREIAALVTEGLTTPAIAARLYLSPRTVDTHLSHIFRKTGVTTRAALAALTARSAPAP